MIAALAAIVLGQHHEHFSWRDVTEYRFLMRDSVRTVSKALERILTPAGGWEEFATPDGHLAFQHLPLRKSSFDMVGFIEPKFIKHPPRVKFKVACAAGVAVTGKPPYLQPILVELKKHGVGWKVADRDRDKYEGDAGGPG